MKTIVALVCLLMAAGASRAEVTYSKEVQVKSGALLAIRLDTGGSIHIVGWDRDVVAVEARFTGRDADNVEFAVESVSGGARIASEFKERRARNSLGGRLDIKLPRRFNLELHTKGGEIDIAGVEGRLEGETMGGDLRLRALRGELDLTTMGGNIRLTESAVDGEVTSQGGNVTLADVCGSVEATTMGGNVVYDNVDESCGGPCREVKISTMGGNIAAPDASCGANLETMGGNITIERAEEYVRAETMGGNISIGSLDGWVHATTMGGRISVSMVGDPSSGRRDVRLESKGGDIELGLPEGLSMEIDVTLAYTKRSSQQYSIESEFPLTIRRTDYWDQDSGDPRKYIYGRATLGGGTHKVKIETVNGDVRIFRSAGK